MMPGGPKIDTSKWQEELQQLAKPGYIDTPVFGDPLSTKDKSKKSDFGRTEPLPRFDPISGQNPQFLDGDTNKKIKAPSYSDNP